MSASINSIIKKYGIYIVLTVAFVPALINVVTRAYGSTINYGWNILYYHVGYETGFGGRKLLGTFCHMIFPDFVQLRYIRMMVLVINFLMVALFALLVGRCHKKSKTPQSIWTVLALYLIGPFSIIAFMTSGLSVQYTETYQIVLSFIWLILWMQYRGKWPFYFFTLIIAVICCLQHHIFCCTLFPLYVGLFVYDIVERKQLNLKNLVGYGSICIILLGLLFAIWKYSCMTISIDQLNDWFHEHVAMNAYEPNREAQKAYYYLTNDENRESVATIMNWKHRYGELIWSLILMVPLLSAMYYPWIRASHTATSRLSSWRYRLVWISVSALTLPVFFMASDYNRWFICFFFAMFAVTVAVLAIGDSPLSAATLRMFRWFTKHPICTVSLVIYLIALHCGPSYGPYGLLEAMDLWEFLQGI